MQHDVELNALGSIGLWGMLPCFDVVITANLEQITHVLDCIAIGY
jgi:hypothetical protein